MSTPTFPWATEQEAQQYDQNAQTEWGTVILDGKPLPVLGAVSVNELAVWEAKFVIGDPKIDDDKYYSVWNGNDFTGGGQIEVLNPGSDLNRFYYATADAEYPDMLTNPLEVVSYSFADNITDEDAIPIGDYETGGTIRHWVAWGSMLSYFDPGTATFVRAADDLTAAPYGACKGVVYDDELFVPLGSSGFDRWNGTTVTNSTEGGTVLPVAFAEWDNKLVALGTDGQVSIWDGSTWTLNADMRLRGNRVPRNLVVWWNQNREPTLFVVTNRDVYACDFVSKILIRTGLRFPVHPDFGLGSAAWQDDSMYVSVGIGMHQLSLGGVVSAMGPDRGAGLPARLRGAIVDLEPEYNGMLALVKGIGTSVTDDSDVDALEGMELSDDDMIVPDSGTVAQSTLLRWTGQGWFTLWESTDASGTPTKVLVSEADDDYRIWWGYGATMCTRPLRRTFYNPKQGAELGIDRFALTSSFQSGKFDAGMIMFEKSNSHFELYLDKLSYGEVRVSFRTDDIDGWTVLGTATGTGRNTFGFDPNGDGYPEGLTSLWIEFLFELMSDDATKTPIINWFSLKFVKVPLQTKSFQFTVPLLGYEQWNGRGLMEIRDDIDALAAGRTFPIFTHLSKDYRVRVAQTNGPDMAGKDYAGSRLINLLELKVPT